MKITRLVHSCLLVETNDTTVIFDPGQFSWDAGYLNLDNLPKIDYVAITHEHYDHFYIHFVEQLLHKNEDCKVIANESVNSKLQDIDRRRLISEDTSLFSFFEAPHELLPLGEPPENRGLHFDNILTHPGDSHSFSDTKRVLAMPMTAPWGSMTSAVRLIKKLNPEFVIPIHDWHWKPEALKSMYSWLVESLAEDGITFFNIEDGQPINIDKK